MEVYPAHIRFENGDAVVQTVKEHNQNTAEIAGSCVAGIGLFDAAYAAGLLHDMGKYTKDYQQYLWAAVRGENVRRGSVIHTFQCCRFFLETHHELPVDYDDLSSEILAYASSAHHGLYDLYNPDSPDQVRNRNASSTQAHGFRDRIYRNDIHYEETKRTFLPEEADKDSMKGLIYKANACLRPIYHILENITDSTKRSNPEGEYSFYLGLLARLLLSSVIEGDRRDTASFLTGFNLTDPPDDLKLFWHERLAFMEKKLDMFAQDTPIQCARRTISDQCRRFAGNPCGIYRLNVPTGSGKTLSSLRFALAHAAAYGKRRIIFTAPLLTILEQNAAILREFIGQDDLVLEHHSNVFHGEVESVDELNRIELLEDSWDTPVIITTQVQFLNTLFSGKTTCVRRLWALCNSVVVLDEVQTIPTHMLTLFNLAVNFLSEICGTTFVLCSATQPCLERAQHPILHIPQDIVPYDAKLWDVFRRTQILPAGEKTPNEITAFCEDVLREADSLLIVCNKRSEAEALFRALSLRHTCYHLSASMCPAHRRQTLTLLEESLARSQRSGEKTICISTQVIEAGVDVSFQRVIRLTAGLDSIIQSAGRCNRNGESGAPSPVYVLNWAGESLGRLPTIQRAKNATLDLLNAFCIRPDRFQNNLFSDNSTAFYYTSLYANMPENHQDYCPPNRSDIKSLYDLLADNTCCQRSDWSKETFRLCQSFRTAGQLFRVFETDTLSAVVPYGEGANLIAKLASAGDSADLPFLQNWLQRAKPYMVSIYSYQTEKLKQGGMYTIANIRILCPEQYDASVGLVLRANANDFLEV